MKNNNSKKQEAMRRFPSVQAILQDEEAVKLAEYFPHEFIKEKIEGLIKLEKDKVLAFLNSVSEDIPESSDFCFEVNFFITKLKEDLNNFSYSLKRVVNGTGVVIHTNLGRSILPESAIKNVSKISSAYSNLEFDLEDGKRGKRYRHIEYLLKKILRCERAIAVNNNAAAVFMALSSFCAGARKEVIVSRGELVEIGGSFRIPDIMRASGAVLVETGTTNKTKPQDYESAVNENTALLLKVHQSNFRMSGFVSESSSADIVSIGRKYNIPVMEDLGSGSFINLETFGLPYEPTAQDVVNAGVDIVTFSGDKLLGGPQAGIIAGKGELIDMIASNPLNRAFRIDKMTLAALESILFEYLDPKRAVKNIPTLFLMHQSEAVISKKARKLLNKIKKFQNIDKNLFNFCAVNDFSIVGGGALPDYKLNTCSIGISHKKMSASMLGKLFRAYNTPIIGKIRNDEFLLDMRTVNCSDFNDILNALAVISK
jgi:L-seryl-tRNA(Ser) seleniumtransferase